MLYRRIQCFLEVAHYLNFSEAARRMFMTQQAVTRQISELEEELGVKLFVRTTRSVNLTPAGRMLRDDFEKIDRETRVAVDRVRTLGERGDPAVLTIGIFSGLPNKPFTIPLVSYLDERFPEVQIEVRLGDMVTMRNQFMDGDLDLCITTSSDWNLWPDAEITVLRRLPFYIVLSVNHPLARSDPFDPGSLRGETLYAIPPASFERSVPTWEEHLPRKAKIFVPDIANIMIRVDLCRGFGCIPLTIGSSDPADLRLIRVPLEEAATDLVAVTRKGIRNPLLRRLIRSTEEYCRENGMIPELE